MKHTANIYAGAQLALMLLATSPAFAMQSGYDYTTVKGGRIVLRDSTLMHEMRQTPSPLDGETVSARKVSFQWPLPDAFNYTGDGLDGSETPALGDKSLLRYRVRYSRDPKLASGVVERETWWPMYNPDADLADGEWYWQYGYVGSDGGTQWSGVCKFNVSAAQTCKFCPPPFAKVVAGLGTAHPRILVDAARWDAFIDGTHGKAERSWYIEKAEKVLKTKMKTTADIATDKLAGLTNQVQRKAYLTRESRQIIDKEEANCNALIYAWLLTRDRRYADEATRRILSMVDWDKDKNVKGDFNDASLLSLSSMAYDSFHDVLTDSQRTTLLAAVQEKAGKMYALYNNHLENHIADNHVWQMTLRILTMASLATYGELPEAKTWAEYCYNMWVARMPGLNEDGAWHNGDSYFTVNTRTLIEVPWLYSRLTGFDFFSDPWYKGNIMYAIYEQPPFSKSGGNGSSHQKVLEPNAVRVGYLDALARLTGDTYAADFVRRTLAQKPQYLKKAFLAKSGDLAWFRLQCGSKLPSGEGLASLPTGRVFPESGLAAFDTDWDDYRDNAMWTFRSSPYGSTSHALANQNAFNTFYGGKSLFYSSGHHTSFVDKYSIYCHRGTRAHNTILVDGMGQRIGTEGYGWMPRHYTGKDIGYVLGDASNAYGEVVSRLWKDRLVKADVEVSPRTGWDKNHVKTYRRHIVDLGGTGLIFVYDELEADKPVEWSYMLHTVINPMTVDKDGNAVHIQATNGIGKSDAWLWASMPLATNVTDQFFVPATNWLKGNFETSPNHWHFTATSAKSQYCHFATIIDTHANADKARTPRQLKDGKIKVADWVVELNIKADGLGYFSVVNTKTKAEATLGANGTVIKDGGKTTTLTDHLPKLEI